MINDHIQRPVFDLTGTTEYLENKRYRHQAEQYMDQTEEMMSRYGRHMIDILDNNVDHTLRLEHDGESFFLIVKKQIEQMTEDIDFLCTHTEFTTLDRDDPHLQHHQCIIKRWRNRHGK
jgi:hypothetical protein